MLGAPLAAEACKRRPLASVDGAIRGGALDVGHRLRAGDAAIATGEGERVDVAIVGAGPSGLSAAWRLERLGIESYVVFDLEAQAGGTSAYGTDGVVPYPWGAHYVPLPSRENRAFVALLGEMNVLEKSDGDIRAKEQLLIRQPEERLFIDGEWREGLFPSAGASEQDRAELRRFSREVDKWAAWRDTRGRRAFTIPVSRCSDDEEVASLDRVSAAKWLDDLGVRSKRVRWYLEYATRDDYGCGLAAVSAWALLFYYAARLEKPGAESAPFVAWPEGNGKIVSHLSAAVGARLKLGRLVTDVHPREEHVDVSVLDVAGSSLTRIRAKHVILAVPKFVCAKILRPWRDDAPGFLSGFSYSGWMVANLHLKRRPGSRGFPLAWDNVIYDSPSLGYVVATHQKLLDYGPSVWTYYYPFVDADPRESRGKLLALDHRSAVDTIVSDLSRAHDGLERALTRVDVWRWGHAMVRPTVGMAWGGARRRAAEPVGRVRMAHSDLSGLALFEEAQDHGVRAAEAVAREMGREFEPLV